MELKKEDYLLLLDLADAEKESIHKEAIHNKDLRAREIDLDFIKIKLDIKIKQLDRDIEDNIKDIETKIYKLDTVLKKYYKLYYKIDSLTAKRVNVIESQIEVLKEVLNNDLEAEQWEECYLEDAREYKGV